MALFKEFRSPESSLLAKRQSDRKRAAKTATGSLIHTTSNNAAEGEPAASVAAANLGEASGTTFFGTQTTPIPGNKSANLATYFQNCNGNIQRYWDKHFKNDSR